jgi:hypothetical protein
MSVEMADHEANGVEVSSKEDLADFIEAMREDLLKDPTQWENATLDRFLEAMAAWVRAMDNFYRNTGKQPIETPTWSVFADILLAAKMYE